jgi:hypothetical protein
MADAKKVRLRAMQTIQKTDADEAPGPSRWLVPGQPSGIFHTTPQRAKKLVAAGYAVELGPDLRKKRKPVADDAPDTDAIPRDFPFRAKLAAAGVNTLSELHEIPDLTVLNGIGDAAVQSILKALGALDEV